MKLSNNPFVPGAGTDPEVLIGRDNFLESFQALLARTEKGRPTQSMIITGLRGVGKTVLLNRFRDEALHQGWAVIEMELGKRDNSSFASDLSAQLKRAILELSYAEKLSEQGKKALSVLRSFASSMKVSLDPLGNLSAEMSIERALGQSDTGELQQDLTDLLLTVGETAKSHDRGLVFLLDELQFLSSEQLEAIIAALHKVVQRKLPITMVGAGLPQIAELAGDAKSYAERLFTFPEMKNLDEESTQTVFQETAGVEGAAFSPEALEETWRITEGYPYFIQELGYAVWNHSPHSPMTRENVLSAETFYEAKLDESFFRVRFDRSSERQRIYLRAMAELGPGPQKAEDVARCLGKKSTQVATIKSELIDSGMLYTPNFGYGAFTVPHFDKYMKRTMPLTLFP